MRTVWLAHAPEGAAEDVPAKYGEFVRYIESIYHTDALCERRCVERMVRKMREALEDIAILKRIAQSPAPPSPPPRAPRAGAPRDGGRLRLLKMRETCTAMYAHILTLYAVVESIEGALDALGAASARPLAGAQGGAEAGRAGQSQ